MINRRLCRHRRRRHRRRRRQAGKKYRRRQQWTQKQKSDGNDKNVGLVQAQVRDQMLTFLPPFSHIMLLYLCFTSQMKLLGFCNDFSLFTAPGTSQKHCCT